MNRDDALFWLSVFWFVAFCGVAIGFYLYLDGYEP